MNEVQILVARSQEGDFEALEELIKISREKVYRLALGLAHNHVDAEDLAQETILRIYTMLPSYDEGRASFDTWVHRITVNLWINWSKRRERHQIVPLASLTTREESEETSREQVGGDSNPEEEIEKRELREITWRLIDELPPGSKAAVVLKEIEGYSYREIAATLGCSESAVKARINYGREILKKKLAEAGYAPGVRRFHRKGNKK